MNETVILQAGQVLTITASAFAGGTVTRLSDAAGSEPFSPVAIAASAVVAIGPFTKTRRYLVVHDQAGHRMALAIDALAAPLATVTDAPAGGTGATAGAYDTAVNRNAMITALNTMIARAKTAGLIA
jgi:hypothetical protein